MSKKEKEEARKKEEEQRLAMLKCNNLMPPLKTHTKTNFNLMSPSKQQAGSPLSGSTKKPMVLPQKRNSDQGSKMKYTMNGSNGFKQNAPDL
eukprot:CAMPEP_0170541082 /NCGR_PEP_ID=MMETSP0211-20121228/919_1 /TAXON_ID=311385 /ORGANISM="Pseudokeronopsis sp., Strain OXSARD2" /LENGTH=91 /DNA_ID=CAMNT_0010843689 /DNA_START=1017 /DNA_END=1292 /DNA_ORIENTATION=+